MNDTPQYTPTAEQLLDKLAAYEKQQAALRATIMQKVGCADEYELLEMYRRVIRTLPSSLGRFQHPVQSKKPVSEESLRQVAAVGNVLRAMQDPSNRYQPMLAQVVAAQLYGIEQLREDYGDLLPLLEGLSFQQMVGLSCTIIDEGGQPIITALLQMGIHVIPTKKDEDSVSRR